MPSPPTERMCTVTNISSFSDVHVDWISHPWGERARAGSTEYRVSPSKPHVHVQVYVGMACVYTAPGLGCGMHSTC